METRKKSWVITLKFRVSLWFKNPDEPNEQKTWVLTVHNPNATQYLGYENKQEQIGYQPEILGLKLVCKTR